VKDDSLIIDAGMHTGRDTEFYLAQGFRVVAIEANPDLIQSARSRFAEALSSEKLILYDVAIADHDGEAAFYIKS
jgi:FkbM family methyltransferase